ncbi:MAG TPA: D-erythronate dehydrogenase [Burkholderiales bacterium]|nr:D-erythronate dehydrogenase [Burkholderiales bacterium]
MKILITGGAGFLGQRLAYALLKNQKSQIVIALVLADIAPLRDADLKADARVHSVTGDLQQLLADGVMQGVDGVFHLAAAVSGECEADIDVGLRANLDTTRALLDACRALQQPPRLVFSSSLAVFGGALYGGPDVIADNTLPMPQNSYGTQKFICEQLIADYTRKGYVDGRSVRLPTVTVRPGKPNKAASGFMSGIIREPLAGMDAVCPVDLQTGVWITSPRYAVAGLIAAYETPRERWGGRTAMNLPGLSVRVAEMLAALQRHAGAPVAARVQVEIDEVISSIVGGWPWQFDTARARALGLSGPAAMDDIIAEYVTDYRSAAGASDSQR